MDKYDEQELFEHLIPKLMAWTKGHPFSGASLYYGTHDAELYVETTDTTFGSTAKPSISTSVWVNDEKVFTVITDREWPYGMLIWSVHLPHPNWIELLALAGLVIKRRPWYNPLVWIGRPWSIQFP